MILFFGTRRGKQSIRQLQNVTCPHCKQRGTLSIISQPNYFHLFWIPLFRVQTLQFAECSHCRRAYYKEEFSKEMREAI
ncbi:zinc-ribbon domain-containing protein [Allomuricauda sp. SCSIO 65647]|uniref:zinc-ribbon domain-containing protein n=1 Tax=Allomuricauda sp. SCSIO 65647 TaxID=2908843 RepID=UPI001F2BD3D7|nr:zinc-ribbon domain-containing protein [Muricauda sp. SCSIO 65647]UJH68220.1 zinc ribbon domain-containing protein [Muricauda sp. SCSIO 65647]